MQKFSKKIFLSPPLNGNEIEYLKEPWILNWIAPVGPNINYFEEKVAKYLNRSYGVALSSGTAALHIALKILGIQNEITFLF